MIYNDMQCGRCYSDDTSTFEMAHLRGSQSGIVSGTIIGDDGNFDWHAGTVRMQTHLAQITAPPAPPVFWSPAMWFGFILSILAAIIVGICLSWLSAAFPQLTSFAPLGRDPVYHRAYITVGEIYFLVPPIVIFAGLVIFTKFRNPSYKREREAFENQMKNWQHSVICLRCGDCWLL